MPALLLGLRIAGMMSFAPFLGSTSISVRFKAMLTIALTVLLYPVCAPRAVNVTAANWLGIVITESCLGLLMGLTVQLVFEGAQFAGQMSSIQMGLSLVTILDPQTQADTPVISVFYQTVALLLFLQFDVHHWMLRALVRSYAMMPVGSVTISQPLLAEFLHIAGAMLVVGIEIAAPVVVVTMIIDISLSFLSKASPQLPVMFVSVPAKFLLGLAVLVAALACWPSFFEAHFGAALATADRILRMAH